MRYLEELQMNALPALQTILYDGWILRFSDGYTNRANSINPIYRSRVDVHEKIERCEKLYRSRGLKPVYKITPFVYPENLDDLLEIRGYKKIHYTSVQTLDMKHIQKPDSNLTVTSSCLVDGWFEYYCKFNNVSVKNMNTYKNMLSNLIPNALFFLSQIDNEVIACGMAVLENSYIGLFDITVSEIHRKKGYGTQLLLSILNSGKANGSASAYLQVMTDNLPALQLYGKLGFKEKYQYFYRIRK